MGKKYRKRSHVSWSRKKSIFYRTAAGVDIEQELLSSDTGQLVPMIKRKTSQSSFSSGSISDNCLQTKRKSLPRFQPHSKNALFQNLNASKTFLMHFQIAGDQVPSNNAGDFGTKMRSKLFFSKPKSRKNSPSGDQPNRKLRKRSPKKSTQQVIRTVSSPTSYYMIPLALSAIWPDLISFVFYNLYRFWRKVRVRWLSWRIRRNCTACWVLPESWIEYPQKLESFVERPRKAKKQKKRRHFSSEEYFATEEEDQDRVSSSSSNYLLV